MCITLGVGAWIFKRDLKQAFRLLGLVFKDWPYACYYHKGHLFMDTRQLWGTRVACKYCNELVQVVCLMFIELFGMEDDMVELRSHVDDIMGGARTKIHAVIYTQLLAMFIDLLGLEDNIEKPEGPAQKLKMSGIYYTTFPSLIISLPPDKN